MRRAIVVLWLLAVPLHAQPVTRVQPTGRVSAVNSSTVPLGISGVFTGAWENSKDYSLVTVSILTDQASATDGLAFEWSSDASTVVVSEGTTVQASAGRAFALAPRAQWFRVKLTNGGTAQTELLLQTVYHVSGTGLISRPLDKALSDENFAQTVRAVVAVGSASDRDNLDTDTATNYLPVRLTDGSAFYAAGGGGGGSGDGKILDGTAAGQSDVMASAPGGSEQALVTRNIPSGTQPVSGPLTDSQLRASAVPVSGPLTDAQLRASAVPVSVASLPTLAAGTNNIGDVDVASLPAVTQGGTWTVQPGNTANTTPWLAKIHDGALAATVRDTGAADSLNVSIVDASGNQVTSFGGAPSQAATYRASVFASAAAASKDHLSVFNASGSGKIVRLTSITVAPELAAAITGLTQSFRVSRYTTDGVTCTAVTIALQDTANAAVPAQVTAKTNCTTDPTALTDLLSCSQDGEDARSANSRYGNCYLFPASGGQAITLREGQGLMLKSSALSGAWPVTVSIEFTM